MTKDEFTENVLAMQQTMYRLSYGLLKSEADREDAVQETICKAWQKRSALRNEKYFRTWIIRILINECHNILRKAGKIVALDELPERAAPDEGSRAVHDAIFILPETQRMPVILYYIEGFNVQEIADMLKIPEGTVKSRLYSGRGRLKTLLEQEA